MPVSACTPAQAAVAPKDSFGSSVRVRKVVLEMGRMGRDGISMDGRLE